MDGNNPGNGKDQFYYSVSEYERRKNPKISNEEVAAKVNQYRSEPEKFHAMAYKELSGGKTIDKKTLQRVSELEGIPLDPNRLSPSEINFVDNDKLDLINLKKNIEKTNSNLALPIDATDEEIGNFWDKNAGVAKSFIGSLTDKISTIAEDIIGSGGMEGVKQLGGDPAKNNIRNTFIENEKKKRVELSELQKSYYSKLPETDLGNINIEDFFADATKKTQKVKDPTITSTLKSVFTEEGDFFSGNDSQQERQNASIDSQKYIQVLEDQLKIRLDSISNPNEKQIAIGIINGEKPEVGDDFKPSQELGKFLQSFEIWNNQQDINSTQFGSIINGKKKSYNQQLAENRQKRQEQVDKTQSWVMPGETPSVTRTWVNTAINKMIDGVNYIGTSFYTNEIEEKIKKAKESGNTEEYLRLQRSLALEDFKRDNNAIEETIQRSDVSGPIWEDRVEVDGFRLQVNSNGDFQRMVDIDGKTVHTLSNAQQSAVNKYLENPKSYKKESGFSRSWGKSLFNAAGQTTVEMVPMIAGGFATAPLRGAGLLGKATSNIVPTAAMFVPQYSTYFKEEFDKTGNWSRSSTYATAMAGVESMAEWLGGGVEKRLTQRLAGRGLTPDVLRTAGQRAANIVANAGDLAQHSFIKQFLKELTKDNLQEVGEELFTLYAQSAIDKTFGKDGHVDTNELLTTILVTPLATAPMSAISNIANYKNSKADFKSMVLAASSDVDKTADIMTEMVASGITSQSDAKKKMDLVKAVASRKDNYSQRSAGMNLNFTEQENKLLEDYMFEEAVGEINNKKVDYTKEVDLIIAIATKRAKLEAQKEKNDPIIPVVEERMKKPLRAGRRNKNEKGYYVIDSLGPDGPYETITSDDKIQEGETSLNFNITNDDAEVLSLEIQEIAAREGIDLRIDLAKGENNTDVPLRVSFNSDQDAQIIHQEIAKSEYYNQMVPQKTDRILGKKIDEKVQFGVSNLKDIRKAQDIIEHSTKEEDGTYLYINAGLKMIISPEEYNEASEILFAADNRWNSVTTTPVVSQVTPEITPQQIPNGLAELRSLVSDRLQEAPQTEPQTRTTDEKGFERLNVKSDTNLQDAFDYTDGDTKEIPVFRNGQKGVLRVNEGGAMEFDNGTQIIEYGNINDQRTSTLSDLGFSIPEDFKVKNGNIVIDGEMYQNPFSSPDAAIVRDENGNITSVELEKREIRGGYNGIQVSDTLTPVTFTGQRAIDVATILMENELATNTKLREEFESFPAPDIQPSFVPKNVTVDQLGEILLDYFPEKPALAIETAKIYFAQAVRMSTIFPQQYPTPASYIIEKINKETVENITEIERLKDFLNRIINTTDDQDRIDFAQRALDNINRINAIKVQSPEELIKEINSKPLNHISLGEGMGMGQNEANGTYLSTETKGNRYELIKTPGAKIFSAKVKITNPYDLDANMDDVASMRNRALPAAIQKYIADNKLTGDLKKQLESVTSLDNDILQIFAGFDQYIADAVTADLQSKGYDSLYSRETKNREGYLVVFNKENVQLTEQKFQEKVIKRKKDGRGKNTFSVINNLISKIGGPGTDPMLHAIEAITLGNISRDSFLQEVNPSKEEAMRLVFSKVLTTKPNGISISKASENREGADDTLIKDAIIGLLNNYDYGAMLDYVTSIANMDQMRDPREVAFENDPEFRAMMEREQAIEAELEQEIMEMIPPDLYAELEYVDSMEMSLEEIQAINDFMVNIPGEEMADVINSLLPFDPEFEFISEQIENKIEDGKQEDIQGEDGDVVSGEAGSNQRQVNDDRQEVEDQGGVVNEIESNIAELESLVNNIPIESVRRPNGSVGTQGFTSENMIDIINFISKKMGINLPTFDSNLGTSELTQLLDYLKANKSTQEKIRQYVVSNPVVIQNLPDGTITIEDGNHRANLLNLIGVNTIPTIELDGSKPKQKLIDEHNKEVESILSAVKAQPKVVDEIDRLQKLDEATNKLVAAKKDLKRLEKEASEYKSNLERNANQNQPNLFGEAQPTLGFDNISEQSNILKNKEADRNAQREVVNNLEKEVESLRDLKNQAEIDFETPSNELLPETPVDEIPEIPEIPENKTQEIADIKEEIESLVAKKKQGYYPEYGLDTIRLSELRKRLIELDPKVEDIKKEVSKKEERVKEIDDLKKEIKKEPISDAQRELNDVGNEFMDILQELKNLKGNLGIYSDPQKEAELQAKLLMKGLQLIDLFIKKGVTDFGEMVKQAVLNFGELTDDFVNAMKKSYTSALIDGKKLTTKFDDVNSYSLNNVINQIEDGQGRTNANVRRTPKRSTGKVQSSNQGQLSFGIPEQEGGSMPEIDKNAAGEVRDERTGGGGSSNSGNVGDDIKQQVDPIEYFEIQEDGRPFNPSTRFNENIEAIELLATLYEEGRPATMEEKEVLSKYVGFGGLKVILNEPSQTWTETDEKLRPQYNQLIQSIKRLEAQTGYVGLLDDMKDSVLNAHFTAIPVIKSMYDILGNMGFKGGAILEPSSGIGNFIGAMPTTMRSKSKITSIEKEPVTGMINRLLYPETSTIINGYEDSGIRNNSQDLVVSNIPFGTNKVYDKTLSSDQKKIANNIHNYFFVKSVNTAREGGIIAFITSTGVMDSPSNRNTREFLAKNTNFLGAFRLPNTAFKGNANTSVTTDIIFLQKNTINPSSNYNFTENIDVFVGSGDKSVRVNEYFAQNPESIIGQLSSTRGLYNDNEMVVVAPKEMDIAQELINRAETLLPKGIYQKGSLPKPEISIDGNVPPNTIYVKDGVVQFNNVLGEAKTLPKSITAKQAEDFIKLRDTLNDLYFESLNNPNSKIVNDLRIELNLAYDIFVSRHGKLNARKNIPLIRDDAKGAYIKTLEKDGKKSDIFTKNTINSNEIPEITNFNDALVYSLQQNGNVDINFISDLLQTPVGQLVEENYSTYIFDDGNGNIVTREEYLSGNVKAKLKQAIELAKTRPIIQKNVEELEKVIPADLNALQIEVNIGARWVDPKYYVDFLNEIFKVSSVKAIYSKGIDEYAVDGPGSVESNNKYGVTDERGVLRMDGYKIFSKTLEGRTPIVYDRNADGSSTVNRELTDAAVEKQNLIKEAFENWIWRDVERREELSSLYNELYNTTVKRNYDGSHLTMPGLSNYQLRPHQKDAIWMIMQNNGGIIDHQVGAGKSLVLIAGAMELKRTGIAKKPIVVGLKSTIPRLVSDAKKAYPMAKILAPNESAFSPANRKALFANIANNDYDIIIMSHEQFGKIPQNPDLLKELMEEELELIEKEIRGIDLSNQLGKAAEKGLIVRKENIEAKIKELADMSKDDVLTFDKTGIDHIMVDESQQFKNLEYTTKVQGVAGLGDPKGSKRSFNMLTAIRQLQQNNGADKGTTFLSGTPISNSMVEMYLLLKYLRPSKLKELGFDTFDAWAKQFARESSDLEFTVAGTISNKTRYREFINVPELSMMYNEIADVRNDNNLKLDKPEADEQLVVIKQSQEQKDFTEMLVQFANTGVAPDGLRLGPTTDAMKKSKMLLVTGLSSKAAIDLRLVFPDAADNPTGKLQIAADKITEIYNNTKEDKGTQLLFSDIGTPKTGNTVQDLRDLLEDFYKINSDDLNLIFNNESDPEKQNTITQVKKKLSEVLEYDNLYIEDLIKEAKESSTVKFTVYAEMKKKLIDNGVNPDEIAFIHDYKSDKQKQNLFEKVNSGEIRIVIGSTQKLGTGVNVQEKIVAMHHIDVPWRPSDMEQRNGRGIRQQNYLAKEKYGNKVKIFKYGTEQTLDAYKYQLLEIKGKFISQVKDGSITDRVIEEDDSNESAKIIAALSGNPLIYDKAVLEKKIDKLNRARKNHAIEVSNAENGITSNTKTIDSSDRLLEEIRQDSIIISQGFRTVEVDGKEEKLPTITVNGTELEIDEKGKYKDIGKKIISAKNQILNKPVGHQQEIATINNLPLYAKLMRNPLDGTFSTDLFIRGKGIYIVSDSNDPGAQAAAITRFITDFEKRTNKLKVDLITAKERLKSYEKFLAEKGTWDGSQELLDAQTQLKEIKEQLDTDKNKNEVADKALGTIKESIDDMIRNGDIIVIDSITGKPCS